MNGNKLKRDIISCYPLIHTCNMKLNSISVVLNGIIAFQTLKKKESEVFNELNMLKKRMMTDGKRKCWQVFIFNKKR